jgi:SAM-dependent methyltransferase
MESVPNQTLGAHLAEASGGAGWVRFCDYDPMKSELFELHSEIERRHWWFVGRRKLVQRVTDASIPATDRKTLVDVGCGTGANVALLPGWEERVGIDTSPDAIDAATTDYPDTTFIRGEAPEALGEIAGRADLFTIMDVMEHVPDDFALFSGVAAAAKPGSHLLVTVPADPGLWGPHDVSFGHYRRYTAERLAMVFEGLRLEIRLLSYFNTRLYPVIRTIRSVNRRRDTWAGENETDFFQPPDPVNNLLAHVMAGEATRIVEAIDAPGPRRSLPYGRGVSLIALVRRLPGSLDPRTMPPGTPPDIHSP